MVKVFTAFGTDTQLTGDWVPTPEAFAGQEFVIIAPDGGEPGESTEVGKNW